MTPIEERALKELPRSMWYPDDRDRFTLDELTTPPPPQEFVWHPYIPVGCACVLVGAGASSKTGLAVTTAVNITIGRPWLDEEPPQPGNVLIVSAEDRRDILRRHVYAATRDLTSEQRQAVTERLFVKDIVGSGFRLTETVNGGLQIAAEVGQLIEYANDIGPRLIVLDTLSRLNGGDEDNEGLARLISAMERIGTETGAATLILHHTGKAQMREGIADQYGGRGGSALADNARSVMHLARVTDAKAAPTNATKLVVEGRLLKLTHPKPNYAMAAPDRWIERVATPYAARLVEFVPQFSKVNKTAETWAKIATWMAMQKDIPCPTKAAIETECSEHGTRKQIRDAIDWAMNRGKLVEREHPNPIRNLKTYLALPDVEQDEPFADDAEKYRRASRGE